MTSEPLARPSTRASGSVRPPGSGAAIGGALLIALAGALPVLMIGALGVQIRAELGIDGTTLGTAVSIWAITAALGAAVLGGLADRLGWQVAMVLAAVLAGASLAGVGLVASTWTLLAVAMGIGGLGHSLGLSSGNIAILAAVTPERRAVVLGLRQSAVPAAGIVAGLSVPLVATRMGWRWSYGLALLIPLAILFVVARTRATHGRVTVERIPFRLARPDVPFAVFGLVAMCGAALVNASATFTVSSLAEVGYAESTSGLLFMLASLSAVTGRIVLGQVADRRQSRGFVPIAVMLTAGVAGFALMATGHRTLTLLGLLLAFAGGTGWPGLTHYVVISRHAGQPGSASGLILTAGFIGGAIGPVGFGLLADHLGYGAGWLACALLALVGAGAALVSGRLYAHRDQ